MNALNLEIVNAHSEYQVFLSQTGKYLFKTDYDILYAVDFELDSNPYYTAYWFNLTNPKNHKSPGDIKIAQTVICIIEEFFRLNPDLLLYLCSTDKGKQAQRARLFSYWFNKAGQQERYYFKTAEIKGEEPGTKEYVAIIVPRNHPQAEDAIAWFNHDTQMFDSMKP